MLIYTHRIEPKPGLPDVPEITLSHEQRRRTRLRTALADGTPIGIALPRATILFGGDVLATDFGHRLIIRAAAEELSVIECEDSLLLTKAAYHLGNRHAALQIEGNRISFVPDPPLDQLCQRLGLTVVKQYRVFEPESLGHHTHA